MGQYCYNIVNVLTHYKGGNICQLLREDAITNIWEREYADI